MDRVVWPPDDSTNLCLTRCGSHPLTCLPRGAYPCARLNSAPLGHRREGRRGVSLTPSASTLPPVSSPSWGPSKERALPTPTPAPPHPPRFWFHLSSVHKLPLDSCVVFLFHVSFLDILSLLLLPAPNVHPHCLLFCPHSPPRCSWEGARGKADCPSPREGGLCP
uniref:Uncharacterized protein n=1 Tax=Pipistrellus kuhlii TaxID=59472 RepID=A0A7J7YME1_PIPKU|nr:hypothetical protein mPipKuh1_010160 [Pipistrellus kuhlii]